MEAVVLSAPGQVRYCEVSEPDTCRPGEVVADVAFVRVCKTGGHPVESCFPITTVLKSSLSVQK